MKQDFGEAGVQLVQELWLSGRLSPELSVIAEARSQAEHFAQVGVSSMPDLYGALCAKTRGSVMATDRVEKARRVEEAWSQKVKEVGEDEVATSMLVCV